MKHFVLSFSAWLLLTSIAFSQSKPAVEVHPGTELLHIVNYLGRVYTPAVERSAYLRDVNQWFAPYKQHPAVLMASHLKYNDFSDLGWCYEFPGLFLQEPPGHLGWFEAIHSRDTLITYIKLCQQFAREANFWQFYQDHQKQYKEWCDQFKDALQRDKPLEKLADFYQCSINKELYFSICPMGISLRANIQNELINPKYGHTAPITIPFDQRFIDDKTTPTDSIQPNFRYNQMVSHSVWHEASHVYWEELNTPYRSAIDQLTYTDPFFRQFNSFKDKRLNNYFFVHEVVADGVAIFLKKIYIGQTAYFGHLQINEKMGGALYPRLVNLFGTKYWDRRKQRNFQKFIPDILQMIRQAPSS